ncbi:MFS transporter [Tahibacter soli]|uniref:MFS transporter n=1 Tax=Tahibacter soli TaxID=2983605 RepID=A0A9X3YPK6_9GAMM|nr:MFS transporter [Tahibacter soli]MDC8016044.1 MFS transporter [Tahibacter soli]
MHRLSITLALILTYMVFAVLLNSVGTVILQSIATFGVTKQGASVLEACKDLPIAVVSFLTAAYLPRFGYRRAMMVGLAIVGVACLAMPLLDSFAMTRVLFIAIGVSFALVKVGVYSSIGLVTADRRAHASLTNTIEGLFMVGVLGGYWLFGAFIDHDNPADAAWIDVYYVLAAICAAALALLAASPLDESAARDESGAAPSFLDMVALLKKPLAYVFLLSAFMYVLIEQSLGTWLPTFNREILQLPAAMSVQIASIYAGSLALGRLGAGVVLRRLSWYPLLNLCVVGMGVLVILTLPLAANVAHDPDVTWFNAPLAAYVLPMIGLLMAPIYPVLNSVMLSALPPSRHAAMTGLIVIFSALGGTTGSLLTGFVFAHVGGQRAFYVSLLPMVAILVALALFRRETERAAPLAV